MASRYMSFLDFMAVAASSIAILSNSSIILLNAAAFSSCRVYGRARQKHACSVMKSLRSCMYSANFLCFLDPTGST